ncbi:hypothetical protein A7U43_28510 (plasmid) [Mycobacterium adipatum]|uniref:PknH-like extracellular domain-containing protein n=1 Tax=Mycobacterium adipatum TaxID=1682113 RepID=A0A172UWL9_9MYCO|nr:sensor domain-containing protein [Mycobacterium adipatum]ANE83456.1 hypothetical protein A7U43_28510 [Mycobacterium adipatum]
MSRYDDERDAEQTTDWPSRFPTGGPADDDGGATSVVPRMPYPTPPQPPAGPPPPPAAQPPMSPPPMSPPQTGSTLSWPAQTAGGGWVPPVPPGQYPPGYPVSPAPTPAPASKGPRWPLIGAAIVVVIALAAGAFLYMRGQGSDSTETASATDTSESTPEQDAGSDSESGSESESGSDQPTTDAEATSAQPSPSSEPSADAGLINPAELSGLLASVEEVSQIADNTTMIPRQTFTEPFGDTTVDPANCTGAVMPGVDTVYNGSGFTGFAGQVLSDAAEENKVLQSIISFPSESDAKAFYDRQLNAWKDCKYADVTVSVGGSNAEGTLNVAAEADGTAKVFIFPPGGSAGRQCEHAMTPRKNVIVDVRVCKPSVGSAGWSLARNIGQKITGER